MRWVQAAILIYASCKVVLGPRAASTSQPLQKTGQVALCSLLVQIRDGKLSLRLYRANLLTGVHETMTDDPRARTVRGLWCMVRVRNILTAGATGYRMHPQTAVGRTAHCAAPSCRYCTYLPYAALRDN